MKKTIIYILLTFCTIYTSCSDSAMPTNTAKVSKVSNLITLEEAQQDLEGILASLNNTTRSANQKRHIVSSYTTASLSTRQGEAPSGVVHIFNFNDNQGFAIMSGDKRTPQNPQISTNTPELTLREISNIF